MERKMINDADLSGVGGGSIMISEDGTTCGRNRNDQYKVMNLNAIITFVRENKTKMPEKKMIDEMLKLGYIANL